MPLTKLIHCFSVELVRVSSSHDHFDLFLYVCISSRCIPGNDLFCFYRFRVKLVKNSFTVFTEIELLSADKGKFIFLKRKNERKEITFLRPTYATANSGYK